MNSFTFKNFFYIKLLRLKIFLTYKTILHVKLSKMAFQ
jgi:hypothetical protein